MTFKPGLLGETIRQARLEQHLSQEKLSELVDITPTHLKHIESEHRRPSIDVLFKLVRILGFSVDQIIFPELTSGSMTYLRARNLLEECSETEQKILTDLMLSFIRHRDAVSPKIHP